MKWIGGLTLEEIKKRRENWHQWFAWHPIRLLKTKNNREHWVWLEYVFRRQGDVDIWEYKLGEEK